MRHRRKRQPQQKGTQQRPQTNQVQKQEENRQERPVEQKEFRLETRTENQRKYMYAMKNNVCTICIGMAGTGKSYLALGLAAQQLKEGIVDKIVIARPTVEASPKSLGALPGDLNEKISPYLFPAIEHLKGFLGKGLYAKFVNEDKIQFKPLEFMRGSTYNNSFMILEESQNCTFEQLKMFITRIGKDSKIVINGDTAQTDLNMYDKGRRIDLDLMIDRIWSEDHDYNSRLNDFAVIVLGSADVIRHPIIPEFLRAMEDYE
jgi:phosphate starvation-inducible PhoH-like protein